MGEEPVGPHGESSAGEKRPGLALSCARVVNHFGDVLETRGLAPQSCREQKQDRARVTCPHLTTACFSRSFPVRRGHGIASRRGVQLGGALSLRASWRDLPASALRLRSSYLGDPVVNQTELFVIGIPSVSWTTLFEPSVTFRGRQSFSAPWAIHDADRG